jgi:hypothetical protein
MVNVPKSTCQHAAVQSSRHRYAELAEFKLTGERCRPIIHAQAMGFAFKCCRRFCPGR